MNGNPWTPQQIEALRQLYPDHKAEDIVEQIGRPIGSIYHKASELKIGKSEEFKASQNLENLIKSGAQHRFTKGQKSWNKGKKGFIYPGCTKTQFKPGIKPLNTRPVGSVTVRADGYSYTKIAEPNVWQQTHLLIWEQAGNTLPVHPQVLRFKDGTKNCVIENLELSSKAAMMEENSIQNLPEDLKKTIQLVGVLNRKINGK